MRPIRSAAVLLLLLPAAACARPAVEPGGFGEPAPPAGVDAAVLAGWKDFPVTRRPRPIVLIGAVLKEAGYRTGEAKIAVMTGRMELATAVPRAPARMRVRLPDGRHELPVIGADEAFAVARAAGDPKNAPDLTVPPLKITKIELGAAEFPTDRGPWRLPAWLFSAADALAPLAVPALAPSAFWRPGELRPALASGPDNRAARDGRALTVTMPAADPPCPGEPVLRHVPVAVESAGAVAVGLRAEAAGTAPGRPDGTCAHTAMLRLAPYTVTLAAPLGNRVVVDAEGHPLAVRPA